MLLNLFVNALLTSFATRLMKSITAEFSCDFFLSDANIWATLASYTVVQKCLFIFIFCRVIFEKLAILSNLIGKTSEMRLFLQEFRSDVLLLIQNLYYGCTHFILFHSIIFFSLFFFFWFGAI